MRRLVVLTIALTVTAVAALLAWAWWTSPPRDEASRLAAMAAAAPADADGLLVLAQPVRAARWLAAHPQVLALWAAAAPEAAGTVPRMRRWIIALAGEASGPLLLYWRGRGVGAAGTVRSPAGAALARLAAIEGLPFRTRAGGVVEAATEAPLLDAGRAGSAPPLDRSTLAGLARAGGRWWLVRAQRARLELSSGQPPPLPEERPVSAFFTTDLAGVTAAGSPEWFPHTPAAVVASENGWALALPEATLPRELQRLLSAGGDAPVAAPPGARRWRGLLGDLWAFPGPGVALASRPELLERLPREPITAESGAVRGADLARFCTRLAEAADGIPGGAGLARSAAQAAPVLAALRTARWRLAPQGGRIALEW